MWLGIIELFVGYEFGVVGGLEKEVVDVWVVVEGIGCEDGKDRGCVWYVESVFS